MKQFTRNHYRYKFNYNTIKGQKEAVSFFGHHIRFIKTPSIEIQMLAVKQNGRSIFYIDDPNENIQMAAIENNPYAIYDIESPTENIKEIAMKHDISIREYFSDKEQKKYNKLPNPEQILKRNTSDHLKVLEEAEEMCEIVDDSVSVNSVCC